MKQYQNEVRERFQNLRMQLEKNRQEESISCHLESVWYYARKYGEHRREIEDLVSVGIIGILKAFSGFSPDRNAQLGTYVSKCVQNEMRMYLRKMARTDLTGLTKEWNIREEQDFSITTDLYIAVQRLSPREQLIIQLRYGSGYCYTQKEIAEMIDVSQSYVCRIEQKALKCLRQYFE